jgi:hypothetical protein
MGYYDLDASGTLPNQYGDFEAQREWSKKMDTVVYKAPPTGTINTLRSGAPSTTFSIVQKPGSFLLSAAQPGTVTLFSSEGRIIKKAVYTKAGAYVLKSAPGCYFLRFKSVNGMESLALRAAYH